MASGAMSGSALPAPGSPGAWLRAVRAHSLTASVIPILIGSTLALLAGSIDWLLVFAMLVAAIAVHAGANMANDFFDDRKGVDNQETLGPHKVIQLGLLSPTQVRNGMIGAFTLATLFGIYIVVATNWRVFALAVAGLGAAFFYTAGSKALGYIALGESTVFIFMGPVMVCGSYYVLTGSVSLASLLLSIPAGAISAATLHANNMRDIEHDRAAGKTTMATLLGRERSALEYILWLAASYFAILVTITLDRTLWPILLVVLTIPTARQLIVLARTGTETRSLNRLLRKTAGLHLRFGSLLIAGLLIRLAIDRIR